MKEEKCQYMQQSHNIVNGAASEAIIGDKLEFVSEVAVVTNAATAAAAGVNKGSHQAGMHVLRHCSQGTPRQPQLL